ncbi:MiaB/RimO family radical SAM methylthiotransferase [Patescibacteria group bacterium]|nr:MiaB/RimO family radical SAM methylthiotransferase [Patescibacteria group bacterium]
MKYFIKTFGCQMNIADSERIAGWYEEMGWVLADKIEDTDEIIINSCSVRESAENRVFGLVDNLSKLKIVNCKLKIILTGCMLRLPKKVLTKKLPAVDEFKKTEELAHGSSLTVHGSPIHAWVPISNGCNNFCTYCVVPYARGREVSKPFEEIICEVKELAKRGYKKITLLGQNVNSFQPSFAKLLVALNRISGIKRISFITSNPWDLTDEIIEAMSLSKIDRYLHLPVQSGDDEILKKMNRPYTAQEYLDLVKKIKERIPKIKFGTDIIVGFPGETERQFENTVELCKKVGFVKAYISRYSPRPGTAAFRLKDDVPPEEKKRRWRILEELINHGNI